MKYLILILFVLTNGLTFAQEKPRRLVSFATPVSADPLYVVNGKVIDDLKPFSALLKPIDIEKLEVLKDAASTAIYGIRGVNGVILVTLKPEIKLISYNELLKKFKVKKKYRQYIAYIGNESINNASEFFASPTWIKEIKLLQRTNGTIDIPYLNIVAN